MTNQGDDRRRADARLAEARKNGSSREQISRLQTSRDIARDAEVAAGGPPRQAGER